jgi:hypothetical protein
MVLKFKSLILDTVCFLIRFYLFFPWLGGKNFVFPCSGMNNINDTIRTMTLNELRVQSEKNEGFVTKIAKAVLKNVA